MEPREEWRRVLDTEFKYVHVCLDFDDGSIPASFRPVSSSFIRQKIDASH